MLTSLALLGPIKLSKVYTISIIVYMILAPCNHNLKVVVWLRMITRNWVALFRSMRFFLIGKPDALL